MISSDTSARADAGKPVSDRRRRRWWLTPLVIALIAAPVWLFAAAIRRSITNGAAVKCASNLRNIGVAIREYAGVHDGNYPDNLGTLYLHSTAEAQNPAMYVCQGTDQRSARGTSPDVVARNIVHGHVSYLLLAADCDSTQTPTLFWRWTFRPTMIASSWFCSLMGLWIISRRNKQGRSSRRRSRACDRCGAPPLRPTC